MKRCSTLSGKGKLKPDKILLTTYRNSHNLKGLTIINFWQEKGTNEPSHTHCWWGYKMLQPLWKSVWQYILKLSTLLPYNSAIPLIDIYPAEMKIYVKEKTWVE